MLHVLSLAEAVQIERLILDDGTLRVEAESIAVQMRAKGYRVQVTPATSRAGYGSVQAIEIDWGARTIVGFADDRRSAGFEVA